MRRMSPTANASPSKTSAGKTLTERAGISDGLWRPAKTRHQAPIMASASMIPSRMLVRDRWTGTGTITSFDTL